MQAQSLGLLLKDLGELPQKLNGNKIAFFLYFSLQRINNYIHTRRSSIRLLSQST
jgi:hypothetical protein